MGVGQQCDLLAGKKTIQQQGSGDLVNKVPTFEPITASRLVAEQRVSVMGSEALIEQVVA